MKPETAPTSPKNTRTSAVADVWQSGTVQRPYRTPWGRLVLLMIVFSVLLSLAMVVGAVWMQRSGPVGWWSKWLPIVTTTIVQQPSSRPTSDAPRTVQTFASTVAGIASEKTTTSFYGSEDITGFAIPLSDNGWRLTFQRPPAKDTDGLVVIRPIGEIEKITNWVTDPSTPFVFAKAGTNNDQPTSFGDISASLNTSVWVITSSLETVSIFPRRLIGSTIPAWPSSDAQERVYALDAPVTSKTGGAVVNSNGQLVGLLDSVGQVWPTNVIEPVLKDLVQRGQFERTQLGIRLRRIDEITIPDNPTARGWLIGAGPDQDAITPNGPGNKAGLIAGDQIIAIDGQPVQVDPFPFLQRWQPGETAVFTIQRAGAERELTVQFSSLRS